MERVNRPSGRKKKITQGSADVFRRDDNAVFTGGKPVGKQDGYADRKTSASRRSSEQRSNKSLGTDLLSTLVSAAVSSASNNAKKGSSFKRILTIAVVIIVGYLLISWLQNNNDNAVVSDVQETFAPVTTHAAATPNTSVSSQANPKRTVIKGSGDDVFTIMVYMCGTDLESEYGMATADLNEMIKAKISDKVNIIIETGGANKWKNKTISNKTNQRYQCTNEGLVLLEDDLGKKSMTDPNTLTDFIQYCKENFPANRNALILWDHGGGSISGYGYDQKFPNVSMTLDKIDTALKNADCDFDFVGFDACLMATLENALMLSDYSDYMIASEETEPGIGWYYTDWISKLSSNTSMDTVDIGQNIIDDFVSKCEEITPRDKTTLSIVDLAELSGTLPKSFNAFASSTGDLIESKNYKTVADARDTAREFGQSVKIDQIDLIHFAQNLQTQEADEMVNILEQCIKYNRTSRSVTNAHGVAIYFPYDKLSGLNTMLSTYDKISMDEEYSDCIKSFANLEAGGQIVSSGSSNPLESLFGNMGSDTGTDLIPELLGSFLEGGDLSSILGSFGEKSWIEPDRMQDSIGYYEQNYIDSANIVPNLKDGGYVVSLSEHEWNLIQSINLNVFVDDGSGYIDLGLDNVYEFDDDGDLMIDYDGTWLAINGHAVGYYFICEDIKGDECTITGRVPALLNGQLVDIILVFDNENPYGAAAGARIIYSGETDTVAKGLIEIKNGDVIDFLCDYYTYDEQYEESYKLGDQLIVDGELEVSNIRIGESKCKVTYQLTDIYNNTYWTPAISYEGR